MNGSLYRFKNVPLPSKRCTLDRFRNNTKRNEKLEIDKIMFCPDSNFSIELAGAWSGLIAKQL